MDSCSQKPSGSDRLGRYYTAQDVGSLLVSQIDLRTPRHIVDLGAGGGALSMAAAARWADSDIITVDVDGRSREALNRTFAKTGRHHHIRMSALSARLPERLLETAGVASRGGVDAGVCNPPFILPKWRGEYLEILSDAGFESAPTLPGCIEAPAIFLAQNMRVISDGGQLGIILPDSLVSAARYRWLRESLLAKYSVRRVIKLPRYSFKGTDALAHILVLQKKAPDSRFVDLATFVDGCIIEQGAVTFEQASDRMDGDYHNSSKSRGSRITLKVELGNVADISRGSVEFSVAKAEGIDVLHTTSISADSLGLWVDLSPSFSSSSKLLRAGWIRALPGDVLIARVGRNFDAKIIGVNSGDAVLTDCVYRIRVPARYRKRLLQSLSSEDGRTWLRSQAYGVSATQLTKGALLKFCF